MLDYEKEMFKAVQFKHAPPEWLVLPQVRIGTGYNRSFGGDRTIDAMALNMYPGKHHRIIAYEFKRTLEDFKKDMRSPLKQSMMHLFCNEFVYIVPEELFNKHGDYLLEAAYTHGDGITVYDGHYLFEKKAATKTERVPFTQGFICSLLRNAHRQGNAEMLAKLSKE